MASMLIPNAKQPSYLNLWNGFWGGNLFGKRSSSEKDPVVEKALQYINNDYSIKNIQDFGCGACAAAKYVRSNIEYIGIDGSDINLDSFYKISKQDLTNYLTVVDSILCKHVLEHNSAWPKILSNLCQSFTKKAVIVIFTPFSDKDEDEIIKSNYASFNDKNERIEVPDIRISKKKFLDILNSFKDIKYTIETTDSNSLYKKDTFVYLEKSLKE